MLIRLSGMLSAQQHLPQLGSASKYGSGLESRKYQHLSESKLASQSHASVTRREGKNGD